MNNTWREIRKPEWIGFHRPENSSWPQITFPSRDAGEDPGFCDIKISRAPRISRKLASLANRLAEYEDGSPGVLIGPKSLGNDLSLGLLSVWSKIEPSTPPEVVSLTSDLSTGVRGESLQGAATAALSAFARHGIHLSYKIYKLQDGTEYLKPELSRIVASVTVPLTDGNAIKVPIVSLLWPIDQCCHRNAAGASADLSGPYIYAESGRATALRSLNVLNELKVLESYFDRRSDLGLVLQRAHALSERWFQLHQSFTEKFDRAMQAIEFAPHNLCILLAEFKKITAEKRAISIDVARRLFRSYHYIASRKSMNALAGVAELHEFQELYAKATRLLDHPTLSALAPAGFKASALHAAQQYQLSKFLSGPQNSACAALCLLSALQSKGRYAELALARIIHDSEATQPVDQIAREYLSREFGNPGISSLSATELFSKLKADLNRLAHSAVTSIRRLARQLNVPDEALIILK